MEEETNFYVVVVGEDFDEENVDEANVRIRPSNAN